MSSIFISYARVDYQRVLPFITGLEELGHDVWIDQISIAASIPWRDEIHKAVRSHHFIVAMVSPAWEASVNCQEEVDLARSLGKEVYFIHLSEGIKQLDPLLRIVEEKTSYYETVRSMLLASSFTWDRAGRINPHLATGRTLKNFKTVANSVDDPLSKIFLKKSIHSRRLKLVTASLAVLTTFIFQISLEATQLLDQEYNNQIESYTQNLATSQLITQAQRISPALGLKTAIDLAVENDNPRTRSGINKALEIQTPDSVDNPSGSYPPQVPPLPVDFEVFTESSGILRVTTSGVSWAGGPVIAATRGDRPTALAWNPESRWFAVGTTRGIKVIDAQSGSIMAVLRGFDGAINQIEWRDNSVIGSTESATATWILPEISILGSTGWELREFSVGPDDRAILTGSNGEIAFWDGNRMSDITHSFSTTNSTLVTSTPDGWLVGTSSLDASTSLYHIDNLATVKKVAHFDNCTLTDISYGGNRALLACFDQVFALEIGTGQVTPMPIDFPPLAIMMDSNEDIFVTSTTGELFTLQNSKWELVGEWSTNCSMSGTVLKPSPDQSRLLITGAGVQSGCTSLRNLAEDRSAQNSLIAPPSIKAFRDASWSPDGRYLTGAGTSGELWIYDTIDYFPVAVRMPTGHELRGVHFLEGGELLVVDRKGTLVSINLNKETADPAKRLDEAREKYTIAASPGLF